METKTLGRYIVAGHGEPTFRGTRIMVADVLEQVKSDMVLEAIIEEWYEALTRGAIAEVVRMAHDAMVTYAPRLVQEIKTLMNAHQRTPHT